MLWQRVIVMAYQDSPGGCGYRKDSQIIYSLKARHFR